jgi:hypothetical protein
MVMGRSGDPAQIYVFKNYYEFRIAASSCLTQKVTVILIRRPADQDLPVVTPIILFI